MAITVVARSPINEPSRQHLTELIERALLARLPQSIDGLCAELDTRAAASSDVRVQLEALGPLARVIRYGDVREIKAERVERVLPVLAHILGVDCGR